nr:MULTISPECIES: DUF488 family protein [Staphylococcus]
MIVAIYVQRIYSSSSKKGVRVLVDRVWPRGVSKDEAKVDYWLKDIGPSSSLRKWFNHDADKFDAFKTKYENELKNNKAQQEALATLKSIIRDTQEDVHLLYGAKDTQHNQAVVLKSLLS